MTFYLNIDDTPFNKIKNGSKVVEMRLFTDKRKDVSIGDELVLKNTLTNEEIKVKVKGVYPFSTFKELYEYFPKEMLGYQKDEEAKYQDMYLYYEQSKIKEYGVVGFHIEKIAK